MAVYMTRPPFARVEEPKPIEKETPKPVQLTEEAPEQPLSTHPQVQSVEKVEREEVVKPVNEIVNEEISRLTEAIPPISTLPQESFVINSTVSIKFGIIGLGQGGGKIADAFTACRLPGKDIATYPAIAINTCVADLQALKFIPKSQRVELPNFQLGAMRQPDQGYAAITQPGVIDDILSRVQRVFDSVDHIIVTAGIGGGTGTGTLQVVCETLAEKGIPVTAMITLPRNLDSVEEKKNAIDFLTAFQDLLYSGTLSSAIVVDNNLLYERYAHQAKQAGVDIDWKIDSNEAIVRIINEMNATTGLASHETFDGAELTKILSSGGCVTFGKAQIEIPDEALHETLALEINEILHSGYLANYTNLSEARFAGVQVIMPPEIEFGTVLERTILDELKQQMPTLLGTYIGHAQVDNQNKVLVYSIVSGMGLPSRAQELARILQIEVDRINEAESKRTQFTAAEVSLKNPFQKGAKPKASANPFAK